MRITAIIILFILLTTYRPEREVIYVINPEIETKVSYIINDKITIVHYYYTQRDSFVELPVINCRQMYVTWNYNIQEK